MADLKIVVGALLDKEQAQQDLTAQLKKIKNLKVGVSIDANSQALTEFGSQQNKLAKMIQKRNQEARKAELQQAKAINAAIDADYKASQQTQTKIAQTEAKRRERIRKEEAAQAKAINAAMDKKYTMATGAMSTIDSNRNVLSGLVNDGRLSSRPNNLQSEINEVNNLIQKYNELYSILSNPNADLKTIESAAQEVKELQRTFTQTASKMRSASKYIVNDDEWQKFQANIKQATEKLKAYYNQNSAFTKDKDLRTEYDDLVQRLNSIPDPKGFRVWEKEFQAFKTKVDAAGKSTQKFSERLRDNVSKFSQWFAIGTVVSTSVQAVKEMVGQVKLLDDSLTELRKVSDLSGASLDAFVDKAFALGSQIGRTGQEVIDATTTFKRAGYTLDESLNLAESALVMTNVGDNIQDTAEAASYLISVLKGFNMSDTDASKVIDMINETSNNAAIDFDNIAEGLRRVSSTMSQTGTSLSETIGLLTGGFGQLRDIEMVSSGKQQAPYVQKCA